MIMVECQLQHRVLSYLFRVVNMILLADTDNFKLVEEVELVLDCKIYKGKRRRLLI